MQTSENITQEIMSLEKRYWKAMQDYDLETALSLTDFPCVVAGSRGYQTVTREKFEEMFKGNQEAMREFQFDDSLFEVRLLNDDTAISAYQIHSTFTKDGKPTEIDAVDTSTWVRRNGKWVCAMHTEIELPKQ